MIDAIVVGSGASAVHAAWPLVKAGLQVAMLDAGDDDERYRALIPARPWKQLRLNDYGQHRYFLGDDFEGIPFGAVRVGAQLTPPRQFVAAGERRLETLSDGFAGMQSHALGGLAAAWGASSPALSEEEMRGWPISRAELQEHYDAVARRIGVCGDARDDIARLCEPGHFLLPRAMPDDNGLHLLRAYRSRRAALNREGFFAGHARLAICTRRHAGRGPLAMHDMEFWADNDRAVYRPRFTVEELKRHANFRYVPRFLVRSFRETAEGVAVGGVDLESGTAEEVAAARLVLAAGTLGTARIVLESGAVAGPLPLASNPYVYYPCLLWRRLGQPTRDRRHSLTQAMFLYRSGDGVWLQAQAYSYRSLLLFKLMKEAPLAMDLAREVLGALEPYFAIVGVHHEDRTSRHKSLRMEGRALAIDYTGAPAEEALRVQREEELLRCLRRIGALPLKRIDPGPGASIHYGGSLPMARSGANGTTHTDGRLAGHSRVYVADGSVLPHLPAKGLTFTLMANANRIGTLLAATFR